MKYLFHIFGCQMNEADAEVLAGHLETLGYSSTTTESEADLILLITCCVREHAESKVYGKLGELYSLKQENPRLILGICGCMPQQEDVARKLETRFPYLDLVFGTHNLPDFPKLLAQVEATGAAVVEVLGGAGAIAENLPRARRDSLKAWVTIMYGCSNFCTYCIVPYVRGQERSREVSAILAEISDLATKGYREITLLGQNVNSYGRDLAGQPDFADLLAGIETISGISRVRYMTSHPRDFTDKLIQVVARAKKVCEHFHLPVQSGSNAVLKAMNRGYSREQYLALVDRIRRAVPTAVITTDIIVGFPGETEEDFAETLSLLREVRFDAAYTFAYSPRSGTVAADWVENLSKEEKNARLRHLIDVVNEISLECNLPLLNQVVELLVEGPSRTDPSRLTGRTRSNKLVHFVGESSLIGRLVEVRITKVQTWSLKGEQVGVPH
ncbi:MAG: tRNA (N6-isopentenyl adenosine(37)-C2)-methylthiotransferase MiaB [Firmicutes bacterium]|nr:tRNA (N6-isopentenyl adenosine(37)-C2)-methylthiotransferase MiaB [Dethiobacter sp.]MBS3888738.1 tRNA (N6-isopentenyl adenosine(37)-C2)-methylthiotransferase MiaB [Bacillota bacterium]MBS4053489.1 tRNA (N6-isopentenyl adenosine(37)-C2)-methylthiotransferase MiaB [Thermaerobacter sp.]